MNSLLTSPHKDLEHEMFFQTCLLLHQSWEKDTSRSTRVHVIDLLQVCAKFSGEFVKFDFGEQCVICIGVFLG